MGGSGDLCYSDLHFMFILALNVPETGAVPAQVLLVI